MDLKGVEEIQEAITSGLDGAGLINIDCKIVFNELEVIICSGRTRFLDVITVAYPSLIFDSLKKFNLLEDRKVSYTGSSPQLRTLGICHDSGRYTLSFEDTTEI